MTAIASTTALATMRRRRALASLLRLLRVPATEASDRRRAVHGLIGGGMEI
jgi:hypothetical protein